ncbi:MAG: NADH-quinone oxidoreductase subunit C [Rhodothermales bacterium]|nr:NADH-quinone oxidoreductase subunit C [Rhodothermales bacterium]
MKPKETQEGQTLQFHFTPADEAQPEEKVNPHAREATFCADDISALKSQFGDDILDVRLYANEHTVRVTKSRIIEVLTFLKEERGFDYLSDLGGADRFVEDERFEVHYNLVSTAERKRLRVKVYVDEDDLTVPSAVSVFPAANWNEREVYDMYGMTFDGHEDLRRMFLPEDFEYYPQRKEFPLLGIPGSLPLPPQTPEGPLNMDPYAAAHGNKPVKSFNEEESAFESVDED